MKKLVGPIIVLMLAPLSARAQEAQPDAGQQDAASVDSPANAPATSADAGPNVVTDGTDGGTSLADVAPAPRYDVVVVGRRPLSRDRTQDATQVDGQQLRDSARASTFEALSQQAGDIYVPGRGAMHGVANGASGGIRIRGLGGSPNSQVLVVEDGVPDYQGVFGHPIPDAYVPFLIDDVLVVKGGDSVLYGTNAMGGVVVIRSRWREREGYEVLNDSAYGSYSTLRESASVLGRFTDQFHADELPTKAGVDALDELRFRDFLRDSHGQKLPARPADRLRLLANMNLATDAGVLNLAGLLLFSEQPQRFKPQFVVKAVKYPGTDIHTSKYDDTEDFSGPLRSVFDDALAFVLRNLHKVQAGRGVNSPGVPEIPPVVFEELLVNALVHRDYLISAPIRLFMFDDRIEIISPGTLPNNLTVENIRAGNSNLRNPILASFVAKGVLPYRGLGSGVPRALEAWPDIDLRDDRDGGLFVATVRRKVVPADLRGTPTAQVTAQVTEHVVALVQHLDGELTRSELQEAVGLTHREHFRKAYLLPALESGLIEMTHPDKPNSRSQRYRLTKAGKALRAQPGTT